MTNFNLQKTELFVTVTIVRTVLRIVIEDTIRCVMDDRIIIESP